MFTGLVEAKGTVVEMIEGPEIVRLVVEDALIASDTGIADSVAINGCCLTVVEKMGNRLSFEAMPETMQRTNLGELQVGSPVNMERALAVGARLGGHFVSGHIDDCGILERREDYADWSRFYFKIPKAIGKQMASKGSIAIDGVSLTIVDSELEMFSVALIPFTLEVTTLGLLKVGSRVNLETDILAKYVERLFEARYAST